MTNKEIDKVIRKYKRKNTIKSMAEQAAVSGTTVGALTGIGEGLSGIKGKPLLKSIGA